MRGENRPPEKRKLTEYIHENGSLGYSTHPGFADNDVSGTNKIAESTEELTQAEIDERMTTARFYKAKPGRKKNEYEIERKTPDEMARQGIALPDQAKKLHSRKRVI